MSLKLFKARKARPIASMGKRSIDRKPKGAQHEKPKKQVKLYIEATANEERAFYTFKYYPLNDCHKEAIHLSHADALALAEKYIQAMRTELARLRRKVRQQYGRAADFKTMVHSIEPEEGAPYPTLLITLEKKPKVSKRIDGLGGIEDEIAKALRGDQ